MSPLPPRPVKSTDPYGPGSCISKEEGERLLLQDVKASEDCVNKYVTVPLNDNQFSALVDFVFNLGTHARTNERARRIERSY